MLLIKPRGEKLFASVTDDKITPEKRREVWDKLHSMFPDGSMINYYYVSTRATDDEKFKAALDYNKKFPKVAAMYNTLGYYYVARKDNDMAKKQFEKYIELYPDGANPYDSMGEFYLNTGDKEKAKKYYTMALERYPFFPSSVIALDKMDEGTK